MPVKILKLPDKLEKTFSHEDKVYVKKAVSYKPLAVSLHQEYHDLKIQKE
jgi:hypothetical protein